MSSNIKTALILLGILVIAIGTGWFLGVKKGYSNGINEATNIFVNKIDSLNEWHRTHPPSLETTEIYVESPPLIKMDTLKVVDTFLFKPDSLIKANYPFAIWRVSYDALNGGLIVETYGAEKRVGNKIGSFSLQGDSKFDFKSSPWESPTKILANRAPFLYTNAHLVCSIVPDYSAIGSKDVFSYFGVSSVNLEYALVIGQRVDISIDGGVAYDKWRTTMKWYPEVGLHISVRIFGRH